MGVIQGKTTVSEAGRPHDLSPSEIENWGDDGKRGMENALRANPLDVKQQSERQIKELQDRLGWVITAVLGLTKKAAPA